MNYESPICLKKKHVLENETKWMRKLKELCVYMPNLSGSETNLKAKRLLFQHFKQNKGQAHPHALSESLFNGMDRKLIY